MSESQERATGSGGRSRGLDRSVDILEHLSEWGEPRRPNEIAAALGAPRSSVYDLVNSLLRRGLLDYAGGEGQVFLGRKLFMFGLAYSERFDLLREARAILLDISERTRETSQLCMLDGSKYTVALMHESPRPFRISASVGERVPIPWTASGRLLVSHLSPAEIEALIPACDFTLPDGRLLRKEDFLLQVEAASRDCFFVCDSIVDTYTRCFAAPVRSADGRCVATVCLVAPREDGLKNEREYVSCLLEAGRLLSAKCGFVDSRPLSAVSPRPADHRS